MKIFIQVLDYNMWSIIVNGPHIPTYIIHNVVILKSKVDWDENNKKIAQLNAKAINALYYALDVNEFNRISTCTSVKKIWDRLEITHGGTSQVKESKNSILVHKYELFKMESNKIISGMYICFTDVVNNLKNLGKIYTNSDLIRKVLRSLPRS